jgi:membrane-bound serine protease (ClpP class)
MFEFGWHAWALLGAGILVIVFEILFPSAGLLGLLAGSLLVAGGYFAVRENGMNALGGYALLVFVLAPVAVTVTFKWVPRTPMGRRMILKGPTFAAREATEEGLAELIGKEGVAATPLRPAGIASFGPRRVDVVTRGQHLAAGAAVRVLRVEGNRVIVEESAAKGA